MDKVRDTVRRVRKLQHFFYFKKKKYKWVKKSSIQNYDRNFTRQGRFYMPFFFKSKCKKRKANRKRFKRIRRFAKMTTAYSNLTDLEALRPQVGFSRRSFISVTSTGLESKYLTRAGLPTPHEGYYTNYAGVDFGSVGQRSRFQNHTADVINEKYS